MRRNGKEEKENGGEGKGGEGEKKGKGKEGLKGEGEGKGSPPIIFHTAVSDFTKYAWSQPTDYCK